LRPNHRATLSPYPGHRLSSQRFDGLSGFDLVTASSDASTRLIRGKREAPWHHEGNSHSGVPYPWGWNVVFEEMTLPDSQRNKRRVQAFDEPIYVADAALYRSATRRIWPPRTRTS
jgi:hypothetical protein